MSTECEAGLPPNPHAFVNFSAVNGPSLLTAGPRFGTVDGAPGWGALGPWAVPGAPEGGPANAGDWSRSRELFPTAAGVTTRDTVLLGFGLEPVPDDGQRAGWWATRYLRCVVDSA
ncbi:hypothetical protein [Streptomyces sp. OE57]|uniref:hypothetical protein n=1 Tax=Streptomyces lacaronensis TaxID=3379885 RepID=UPI0039B78F1E